MHESVWLKLAASCKQVIMIITSCVGILITIPCGNWECLECYPNNYWHLHIGDKSTSLNE